MHSLLSYQGRKNRLTVFKRKITPYMPYTEWKEKVSRVKIDVI